MKGKVTLYLAGMKVLFSPQIRKGEMLLFSSQSSSRVKTKIMLSVMGMKILAESISSKDFYNREDRANSLQKMQRIDAVVPTTAKFANEKN